MPVIYHLTPAQLHDAAMTLENDGEFYARYKTRGTRTDRREQIVMNWKRCCGHLPACTRADREQLRRYFDSTWSLLPAPPTPNAVGDTLVAEAAPTIEFWLDEVKYPSKPPDPVAEAQTPYRAPEWYLGPPVGSYYNPAKPPQGQSYANHMARWSKEEEAALAREFCSGFAFKNICTHHGRTPEGILARLVKLNFLQYRGDDGSMYVVLKPPFNPFDKPSTTTLADVITSTDYSLADASSYIFALTNPKGTTMNANTAIEITTKTLVNGVDVNTLSDAQIYDAIAKQEAEITKLDAIKSKPQRLRAEIDRRQAGIKALVDYLDSKDAKPAQEDAATK